MRDWRRGMRGVRPELAAPHDPDPCGRVGLADARGATSCWNRSDGRAADRAAGADGAGDRLPGDGDPAARRRRARGGAGRRWPLPTRCRSRMRPKGWRPRVRAGLAGVERGGAAAAGRHARDHHRRSAAGAGAACRPARPRSCAAPAADGTPGHPVLFPAWALADLRQADRRYRRARGAGAAPRPGARGVRCPGGAPSPIWTRPKTGRPGAPRPPVAPAPHAPCSDSRAAGEGVSQSARSGNSVSDLGTLRRSSIPSSMRSPGWKLSVQTPSEQHDLVPVEQEVDVGHRRWRRPGSTPDRPTQMEWRRPAPRPRRTAVRPACR